MARIRGTSVTCYNLRELRARNKTSETTAARKCGKWVENRVGVRVDDRGLYCVGGWDGYLSIEDPLTWDEFLTLRRAERAERKEVESVDEVEVERKVERKVEVDECGSTEECCKEATPAESGLLSLPTELLLQILRLVVANNRTLHITRCKSSTAHARRAVSIHQVYWDPEFSNSSDENLEAFVSMGILPVALVCRQLKEAAYSVFYGENQWVLEVAPGPVASLIKCLDENREGLVSWAQVQDVPNSGVAGLHPLSRSTTAYIRDLTLCINCTDAVVVYLQRHRYGSEKEKDAVRAEVKSIVDSFRDPKAHSLRRLTVCVGALPHDLYRKENKQLVLTRARENGRILKARKSAMEVAGPRMSDQQKLHTGRMISPLLQIRGVTEIDVGGNVSASIARELCNLAGNCSSSDMADGPWRKRLRMQ